MNAPAYQLHLARQAVALEMRARKARVSFWEYRKLITPNLIESWFHQETSEALQQFWTDYLQGNSPKLIIQAPPQHGKSSLVVDFISWVAGQNPDLRTIYTSFSERLGVRANLRLQRLYDSATYKAIFFDTRISSTNAVSISAQYLRNKDILEYIESDGYFRNTTVCGSITGESLDLGVIDDPIKGREQANSEVVRNKTWEWLTDDFFTRFSECAGLLCILTRWHPDDPIGRYIAHEPNVKVLTYPAIAIEDEPNRKCGEALCPELKSLAFLQRIKLVMSSTSFEALYQQSPTLREGNMFKPDNIPLVDALPDSMQYIRSWDFAATDGGGAYTCGFKWGITAGGERAYICDIVRLQGSPDEVEKALINTAKRDGQECTIHIPQDPGQAGKSQVAYFVKQLKGYSVFAAPVTGDKATNAEPFAAQCNVGNVSMLRAAWNDALIDEMRSFPNGKYKDQIDAGATGFKHITMHAGNVDVEVVTKLLSAEENW